MGTACYLLTHTQLETLVSPVIGLAKMHSYSETLAMHAEEILHIENHITDTQSLKIKLIISLSSLYYLSRSSGDSYGRLCCLLLPIIQYWCMGGRSGLVQHLS